MKGRRGSFVCRLRGHQWHTKDDKIVSSDGMTTVTQKTTTFFALDYCARCGEPSPALRHPQEQTHG